TLLSSSFGISIYSLFRCGLYDSGTVPTGGITKCKLRANRKTNPHFHVLQGTYRTFAPLRNRSPPRVSFTNFRANLQPVLGRSAGCRIYRKNISWVLDPHRAERVSESIREELEELIGYEMSDPRVGSATVAEVHLSPDFRHAHISLVLQGSAQEQLETLEALN